MQIVLLHDRLSIEPEVMEKIKNDIIAVLSKYMEIDHQTINVRVEQGKDYAALVSNVHVKRVFRHGQHQPTNAK
jgi:cell division topological specificity factor